MVNLSQPSEQDTQRLIAQLNNGQLAQAEQAAKSLIAKYPNVFILHHVLALALDGQQKFSASVISYQKAISLQPKIADLHFNLGIALTHTNQIKAAVTAYQQAIKLNAQFFEAHGNLGAAQQNLGLLDEAIASYQKGLAINPKDARGHFNLGTALRDKGNLTEAIASYQNAISLFPTYTDAYNNLGETLRDYGDMDAAVKNYQKAISLNPKHPNANYNMGEFLYLAKQYKEASDCFERAQLDDWQARSMVCLYKAKQFDAFKEKLDSVAKNTTHTSALIATLSNHYAVNFNQNNPYNFCKNATDFVYQNSISALTDQNNGLLKQLLIDIENKEIAERVQGMLHYGKQSAGNLFKRPEASFKTLAELIKKEFIRYKNHFSDANCALIKSFPKSLDFTSSWFVKMQKGGHLSSHIHEIGWVSGAVYLSMPPNDGDEGAFEYSTHGDHYPIQPTKKIDDFAIGKTLPKTGDIILFPSSLFHRTIPFAANKERICIAFDLKPEQQP